MSRFNLIDEKWIPVRFADDTTDELGIRETLQRANEISTIEDQSPLVVAALHRFLLALLYRALEGPTDIDQAKSLFKGGLPIQKIEAYLEKWRDRFWLFDEKYPFGQIPEYVPKEWRSWTALAAEHNADNAKVLFDHMDVHASGKISEARALRWILATQTFALGGGNSEFGYTSGAPSASALMVLPLGQCLSDTLAFSLVPQNLEVHNADRPAWERMPETVAALSVDPNRPASGLADLYTWQIRAIRLQDDGQTGVGRLAFASGVSFSSPDVADPMLAFRIVEKLGMLPIQFKKRGIWRDFDSLLPDASKLAPRALEHAATLARSDRARMPRSVLILGQANNKAKIEFWRMERFTLPGEIAADNSIRSDIRKLLNIANGAEEALGKASKLFAENLLSHGDRNPDKKDVRKFVAQMSCSPLYWSNLETKFHETLNAYSRNINPDDIEAEWHVAVHNSLKMAWQQHCSEVSTGSSWIIRAVVKAEQAVRDKLMDLDKKIKEFKPAEVA